MTSHDFGTHAVFSTQTALGQALKVGHDFGMGIGIRLTRWQVRQALRAINLLKPVLPAKARQTATIVTETYCEGFDQALVAWEARHSMEEYIGIMFQTGVTIGQRLHGF